MIVESIATLASIFVYHIHKNIVVQYNAAVNQLLFCGTQSDRLRQTMLDYLPALDKNHSLMAHSIDMMFWLVLLSVMLVWLMPWGVSVLFVAATVLFVGCLIYTANIHGLLKEANLLIEQEKKTVAQS